MTGRCGSDGDVVDRGGMSRVVCACRQWSSEHPGVGTLVRHVMCRPSVVAVVTTERIALTPAP